MVSSWLRAVALIVVMASPCTEESYMQTEIVRISAVVEVACCAHHASLQVALHVTKRQNGAKAINRVSVRAGIRGTNDSNEALSNAVSVRSNSCWFGGNDTSIEPARG